MVGSVEHFLHFLFNVKGLIEWGGALLVCVIVFVETGFFVGFFLPGDSLLVTAGVFAASGQLHLSELILLVPLCAIVGDQVGYWIGRNAGHALYRREDSLLFKKRHLRRAHDFYEKYGGKTVVLARFVPVVRTFCPPVAGAAEMPYPRYLAYDVLGGLLWVGSMILGGYFLGRQIPNISENIHYVIAVVIFLSLLPPIIGFLRSRNASSHAGAQTPPVSPAASHEQD
jgi:membrane-associated protein